MKKQYTGLVQWASWVGITLLGGLVSFTLLALVPAFLFPQLPQLSIIFLVSPVIVASFQWMLLRSWLKESRLWIVASAGGSFFLLGPLLIIGYFVHLSALLISLAIEAAIAGLIAGVFQMLVLRISMRRAWLWIPLSGLSWSIAITCALGLLSALSPNGGDVYEQYNTGQALLDILIGNLNQNNNLLHIIVCWFLMWALYGIMSASGLALIRHWGYVDASREKVDKQASHVEEIHFAEVPRPRYTSKLLAWGVWVITTLIGALASLLLFNLLPAHLQQRYAQTQVASGADASMPVILLYLLFIVTPVLIGCLQWLVLRIYFGLKIDWHWVAASMGGIALVLLVINTGWLQHIMLLDFIVGLVLAGCFLGICIGLPQLLAFRRSVPQVRGWIGANIVAWMIAVPAAGVLVNTYITTFTTVAGNYHVYDLEAWVFEDAILNWQWNAQGWGIAASWLLLWTIYACVTGIVLVRMYGLQTRKNQLASI